MAKPRCKKSGHKMKRSHQFCPECGSMPVPMAKNAAPNTSTPVRTEEKMAKKVVCTKAECGLKFKKGTANCPHCGSKAPEIVAKAGKGTNPGAGDDSKPGKILVKCECGNEQSHKKPFCGGCGKPMAEVAKAQYEAALDDLRTFAKARKNQPDALEVEPTSAVGNELFAKAEAGLDVDPSELITEFARGHNAILDEVRAGNTNSRVIEKGLGLMAKAMVGALSNLPAMIVAAVQQQMGSRLDAFLNASAGTRARVAGNVTLFGKALPEHKGTEEADDTLKGPALWKAVTDLEVAELELNPARRTLQSGDATIVQSMANQGWSLGLLAKSEDAGYRALAQRITRGLTRAQKGAEQAH